MPEKLQTVVAKIDRLSNSTNVAIVKEFFKFLKGNGTSELHQKNSLKAVLAFGQFLGPNTYSW